MLEELTDDIDIPDIFTIEYLEMSDGAKLRRIFYHPENPKGIVFLFPGLNTLVLSWIIVLNYLVEKNYKVEYVESREKYTAILDRKKHLINKDRFLLDCAESIEKIGLVGEDYIAIGSSMGSVTLIHCMARNMISTPKVILVGPPLELSLPLAFRIMLIFVNDWFYRHIGMKIIRYIVVKKFTNEDADPKQKRKYKLAIELADIWKLKNSIKAWNKNRVHEDLPLIDGNQSKCYLIGASEDRLHPDTDTRYIADNIKESVFIDLKTNDAAHDTPLIELIDKINSEF